MSFWKKLSYLLPYRRRAEERDMQKELESLKSLAEPNELGNLTLAAEDARSVLTWPWAENAFRNLRFAARALTKTPGFTATVILTLALGIGANSAVFSAIYTVILKPLPFPNATQLVTLGQSNPKMRSAFVAPVRLADWNRLNSTFQAMSGYYIQDDSELSGELPERLTRAIVAPRFLEVWGVAPQIGRDFTPLEEHFNGPAAILISDRLWRRRFNSDPNVIGKRLRFGSSSVPIVGVMPASFFFPVRNVDLWSPGADDAPFARGRELTWYNGIGRLKDGVTAAQARENMNAVQANLAREFPKPDAEISPTIEPLHEVTIGGVKSSLWILFGSVSLLLLIACSNVAGLLLSRAISRREEISVRYFLGASRSAVIAYLLAEVFILSVVGSALGLLFAAGANGVFRSLARNVPRIEEIALDWRILLYSLVCAIFATIICGILPALRGAQTGLAGTTRPTARRSVSAGNRTQFALVGVQVALAVTLLAGSGLLLRSLQQLGRVSPGFEATHVLTFQVSSSWGETADIKAGKQRIDRILDGLRTLPGIDAASVSSFSLPGVPADYEVELKVEEGRSETEPKIIAQGRSVSPTYFTTMSIPLVAGTMCRDDSDVRTAMVNRAFANAYFAGTSPVGRHLSQPGNIYVQTSEVRGVVGDARETGLDREPVPTLYWCFTPSQPGTRFLVRTHGEPQSMGQTIRRAVHQIEPNRSVFDVSALADQISDAYAANRLRTVLLIFFAAAAMLLACVGLYGTISHTVNVRRREVGLRLALGAKRTRIAGQFLFQGIFVSTIGCVAGIGMAAGLMRLVSGMLFGVTTTDPATLAGVVGIVIAVCIAASLLPAVRAARSDPMEALREE
jgi:putative ABC transport system permease protein